MITIESENCNIHLFGRTENKQATHEIIRDFKPYFYVRDENGPFTALDGTKVQKVIVDHPGFVKREREKYEKTWESDIVYTNRYLIDRVPKIEKQPYRVCYLDIETLGAGGEFPEPTEAKQPITSITCFDSFERKYVTFVWRSDQFPRVEKTEAGTLFYFNDEKSMMLKFMSFIKATNPDILTAWFGDTFDFPYILNRIRNLEIKLDDLGRIPGTRVIQEAIGKYSAVSIRGRVAFDLYWAYRYMIFNSRESWSLDYIGGLELGIHKIEYEGNLDELREKDLAKYIEYNIRDVEILVKLDEKLGIVDFFDELRILAKCTWGDLFTRSRMNDYYILNYCKSKNIVLPTIGGLRSGKKHNFQGAVVLDIAKGLHENVMVFDLKSLYPSIMVSYNMSPETIQPDGDIVLNITEDLSGEMKEIKTVRFRSQPEGIIPAIVKGLFGLREFYKKKQREAKWGTEEYRRAKAQQYSIKMLTASLYGALAYDGFRLHKEEISQSITFIGRSLILWSKRFLEQKGCVVVAGDTDSIIFKFKETKPLDDTVKLGYELLEELNDSCNEFVKQFNLKEHILQFKFEKVYETAFFGGKKRYAGKVIWEEGKAADEIQITGYESRRSDTPTISRDLQKEVFQMILNRKSKDEIFSHVQSFCKKVKDGTFKPEQIALPIGLSKKIEEYGKVTPIHVRAIKHANKYHKANIKPGTKSKYIFVKSSPNGIPYEKVVAFTSKLYPGYEVDTEKQLNRIVYMKLERIFDGLEWSIEELKGQKTLAAWFT